VLRILQSFGWPRTCKVGPLLGGAVLPGKREMCEGKRGEEGEKEQERGETRGNKERHKGEVKRRDEGDEK